MKYKIIELGKEWEGKTLQEVKDYLDKTYPNRVATEKDIDYMYEHQDEFKDWETKKWTWDYFFGSLVRGSGGHWCVPCASWGGSGWSRNASMLVSSWDANYRVVLLEISSEYCECKRCKRCESCGKLIKK